MNENVLTFYIPHYVTERQQRHRHKLHVLYREWKAYDRQCKQCREQQVHNRQLEPRQDDPDDVHDKRNRPARRFGLGYLATKGCDDAASESKTHQTERYADDREAQQYAAENIAQEDCESTENEKDQIA
jgi:hypothetical protein